MLHSLLLLVLHSPTSSAIYTLSLHDALPILRDSSLSVDAVRDMIIEEIPETVFYVKQGSVTAPVNWGDVVELENGTERRDRKSTRLNSSHVAISYAVFCLKKKIRA